MSSQPENAHPSDAIQAAPKSESTPGIVTAGFVLSILGFICGLPAILGLIFGIVGLPRSRKAGRGAGLAISAIVISSVWLVLIVVLTVILVAADSQEASSEGSNGDVVASETESEVEAGAASDSDGDTDAVEGDSPCKTVSIETYTRESMDDGLVWFDAVMVVRNTSTTNQDFRTRYQVQDMTQSKVVDEVVWDAVIPADSSLPIPIIVSPQVAESSEIELVQQRQSCEPTKKEVFFADVVWENPTAICDFGDEAGQGGCPLGTITNDTDSPITIDRTFFVHFDEEGKVTRADHGFPDIGGTGEVPPGFSLDVPVGGGDLKGAARIEAWGQT